NIQIPLGEPILIRATNSDLVVHNLRLAGLDGQFMTEDDAVTDPDTIAAGNGGELTFAPPIAGAYTFRCDFHPETMGGLIVVQ
ncbi:MAG: plastocyanin/azurin family copper-binding protein, partial [Dehalococcoidia bacterium]